MKDRILNIGIIVLLIACLILGGRLLYTSYMDKCEIYNQNIIDFTVDMIKGHKSLEDIDTLDANDSVKESLRQYYNDTFYSDDDLILIYEDVAFFREHKEELKEIQKGYGEEIYNPESSYYFNFINEGEDCSEEDIKYANLAMSYLYIYDEFNNSFLIEKNNNLYVPVEYINFSESDDFVVYFEGLKIDLNKYDMGKVIQEVRAQDAFFNSLKVLKEKKSEKNIEYFIKNENKAYIVSGKILCETSLNKITTISVELK